MVQARIDDVFCGDIGVYLSAALYRMHEERQAADSRQQIVASRQTCVRTREADVTARLQAIEPRGTGLRLLDAVRYSAVQCICVSHTDT